MINIPIVHDVPVKYLPIPVVASAFCYFLPTLLDKLFPRVQQGDSRFAYLRCYLRNVYFDELLVRQQPVGHILRVQVGDNLYISMLVFSILQLKKTSSYRIFDDHRSGKYAIYILFSCMFLHLCRVLLVKIVPIITTSCLPQHIADRINDLIMKIAPSI